MHKIKLCVLAAREKGKKMFQHHNSNLKLIENAIKLDQRDLRYYISTQDDRGTYIYTKILSQLISSWSEVRVLILVYERSAFNDNEKQEILSAHTLRERWVTAFNIAICKTYRIQNCNRINKQLPFTSRLRYQAIIALIDEDLLEAIEVRNRIAHGQWMYAFTNDLREISTELTGKLRQENIVELQLKYKLFKSLAQIIHNLAVSPPTFERDFDKNYQKIEEQKHNLHNRNYENYRLKMIEKYQRGLEKR